MALRQPCKQTSPGKGNTIQWLMSHLTQKEDALGLVPNDPIPRLSLKEFFRIVPLARPFSAVFITFFP